MRRGRPRGTGKFKEKTEITSVLLPVGLKRSLEKEAEREGKFLSDVIREALDERFRREDPDRG